MIETVRATIAAHSLLSPGDRVVVAVSGGPDSAALLHVLVALQDELPLTLQVAHLNHCFRGAEADQDADYVADLAHRLGVSATIRRVDVPRYQREHKLSAQQAARTVRHAFLRQVAAEVGATRIALGHTADDRVETILLHLLRGAGLEGLGGLPARRDPLIRPLLDCWREETEAYCAQHRLAPRQDPSNWDLKYLRNKIRQELIPLLERDYAPGVKKVLRRTAQLAEAMGEFYHRCGVQELACRARPLPPDSMELEVGEFQAQPVALQWQILREMVRAVRGHLEGVTYSHIEALRQQALHPHGCRRVFLPGGWMAEREYNRLRLGPVERWAWPSQSGPEGCWALDEGGITECPELGWAFRVTRRSPPAPGDWKTGSRYQAYLDAARCAGGLWVRAWRAGDRMQPLGLGGTKTLQDIFTDRKIPSRQRSSWPLVVTAEKIAWVVGYTIDESFRLTEETQEVLYLEAYTCLGG